MLRSIYVEALLLFVKEFTGGFKCLMFSSLSEGSDVLGLSDFLAAFVKPASFIYDWVLR